MGVHDTISILEPRPSLLFLSGREPEYIRNRVLIKALKTHFRVIVLTSKSSGIVLRTLLSLGKFLKLRRSQNYDICVAGFYGQPIAIALHNLQSRPVILDAYVSTYDTLCEDRKKFPPNSLVGKMAAWLDRYSCKVSSRVITDTGANAAYFRDKFGVAEDKIFPVYVGCDEDLFYPCDIRVKRETDTHKLFYYSSFLPLHGVEVVIQAAELLKNNREIEFVIGGEGMGRNQIENQVREKKLRNIELVGWIPFNELPKYIGYADICLGGHFSKVPKAGRVISTKTFQFIAMRKPTIVADCLATREVFVNERDVLMVSMGNPSSLAEAIMRLVNEKELRKHIAEGGYEVFRQQFSTSVIATHLSDLIGKTLCESVS